jgi:hypothetical protein
VREILIWLKENSLLESIGLFDRLFG